MPGGPSAARPRGRAAFSPLSPAAFLVALAACAAPPVRPTVRPQAPPASVRVGSAETGLASWYGDPYHGRRTSSGEVYDMNQLTAAHRDLPLGTWAMVTNLENGRSVEVRINDRGPFKEDRIIDLSYAAARLIGLVGPGTARVRIQVTQLPTGAFGGTQAGVAYAVQAGSFTSEANARALQQSLSRTYPDVEVVQRAVGSDRYYRVRVGSFPSRTAAAALAERLAGQGYSVLIVERD